MTRHNVRLVFVDGDEGCFEVDDNGTSPQSTFETKGGKTYPLPEAGCVTAGARVCNVVTRFCLDPELGVPSVRAVHTDREIAQGAVDHDYSCALYYAETSFDPITGLLCLKQRSHPCPGIARALRNVFFVAPDGIVTPAGGF